MGMVSERESGQREKRGWDKRERERERGGAPYPEISPGKCHGSGAADAALKVERRVLYCLRGAEFYWV